MQQNIENTFNLFDTLSIKLFNYLYTFSIVKEAVKDKENSGGIIIIGLIVIIVDLIGFIMTNNKN